MSGTPRSASTPTLVRPASSSTTTASRRCTPTSAAIAAPARTICSWRRLLWATAPTPARGPLSARTFHQVLWLLTWPRNAICSAGSKKSVQAHPPPGPRLLPARIHQSSPKTPPLSPKGTRAHERSEARDREESHDLLRPLQRPARRRGGLPARDEPGADLRVRVRQQRDVRPLRGVGAGLG